MSDIERNFVLTKGQLRAEFAACEDWEKKLWLASAFHAKIGGFVLREKQIRSMSAATDKKIFEIVVGGQRGGTLKNALTAQGLVKFTLVTAPTLRKVRQRLKRSERRGPKPKKVTI